MLPTREESERQIRDASPAILMAILVASVVSAASSTAILGVELYREYRAAQMMERFRNPPAFSPFPGVDE